jgi:WD40 repeat protein
VLLQQKKKMEDDTVTGARLSATVSPWPCGLTTASPIISISFNQSHTCFTVGTESGYALYRVDPLEKICERDMGGGIGIAVQLFETNFIGLVGGGKNPRFPTCKFVLWDDYKAPLGDMVIEEIVKDRIVGVRLNNDVVALLTRRHAFLYALQDMARIADLKTDNNPDGVCALSSSRKLFLCPDVEIGTVRIFDYERRATVKSVKCHEHPLKYIALNTTFDRAAIPTVTDNLFVTASHHGTLLKVFDIDRQNKVKEFRRGGDTSDIYALAFSRDSNCLVATSSKGTVHVYSLSKEFENVASRASMLGGLASYFNSEWSPFCIDFASSASVQQTRPGGKDFQTTNGPAKHVACLTPIANAHTYRLLIVSEEGVYAIHDLQFKDTKAVAKVSGLLQDLRLPTSRSATATGGTKQ